MILRGTQKWIARLLLGAALFAQFALAANACTWPASPAKAFSSEAIPLCYAAANQNLCLAQCNEPDRASGFDSLTHIAPPAPEAVVPPASFSAIDRAHPDPGLSRMTAPPLSIRFCSYLT